MWWDLPYPSYFFLSGYFSHSQKYKPLFLPLLHGLSGDVAPQLHVFLSISRIADNVDTFEILWVNLIHHWCFFGCQCVGYCIYLLLFILQGPTILFFNSVVGALVILCFLFCYCWFFDSLLLFCCFVGVLIFLLMFVGMDNRVVALQT